MLSDWINDCLLFFNPISFLLYDSSMYVCIQICVRSDMQVPSLPVMASPVMSLHGEPLPGVDHAIFNHVAFLLFVYQMFYNSRHVRHIYVLASSQQSNQYLIRPLFVDFTFSIICPHLYFCYIPTFFTSITHHWATLNQS